MLLFECARLLLLLKLVKIVVVVKHVRLAVDSATHQVVVVTAHKSSLRDRDRRGGDQVSLGGLGKLACWLQILVVMLLIDYVLGGGDLI